MCVGEGGRSVHVREEGVCEGGACVCEGGRSVYSRMYMSLPPSYHFGSLSDLSASGYTAILSSSPLVILQTCLRRLLTTPLRRDVCKRPSLAFGRHSG